jgi:hypothetical protein
MLRLLVPANFVRSSPNLVALMTEATRASETSVFTGATLRNIPEDGILQGCLLLTSRVVDRYELSVGLHKAP